MLSGKAATIGHISCTTCINTISYDVNTCGIHFDQESIIKIVSNRLGVLYNNVFIEASSYQREYAVQYA